MLTPEQGMKTTNCCLAQNRGWVEEWVFGALFLCSIWMKSLTSWLVLVLGGGTLCFSSCIKGCYGSVQHSHKEWSMHRVEGWSCSSTLTGFHTKRGQRGRGREVGGAQVFSVTTTNTFLNPSQNYFLPILPFLFYTSNPYQYWSFLIIKHVYLFIHYYLFIEYKKMT